MILISSPGNRPEVQYAVIFPRTGRNICGINEEENGVCPHFLFFAEFDSKLASGIIFIIINALYAKSG
jgi:hypothetical protein